MARKEKTYLHQNSKPVKSSLVGKMFVNKEIDEFDEFYVNDKAKGIVDLYNEDELVWEVIASDDDAKKRMEQLTRNSSEKKHAISPLQKIMKTMNLSKEDNVSSGVNEKEKEINRLNAKLERQEKAIGYLNDQNKEIYAALNRLYTDFQILLNLVKQEEKKLSPEDKTSYSKLLNKVKSLANGVLKEKMESFGFLNKGEVFRIQSEKALILKEKGVSQELQQKALEAKAELDLLEATREDIEKKQNELKEGANDLDARRKELDAEEEKQKAKREELDAEEEKQKAKREKLDAEEQRLAKLEEKLSALAEKLNSDQDKQKTRQSELDARETAVKEKEEKLDQFEALIADLEAKAQCLTAEVDQLEERRKNLDQSSIKTVTENVRQECRNRFALEKKALEEKASKEKTIREAQFEQEKAKWMGELNLQTEKNAQLTAQIQALDTAKKELDAKKKDLDELEQKLEQYKAELRKQGRAQEECRKKQLKREEEQNKRADDLNEMLKRIQAGSKYCSLCGTELKGGRCPKCWSKNQPN